MTNTFGNPQDEATIIFKCTEEERQAIVDIGRRAGVHTTDGALRVIVADYLKRHLLPAGPHRVMRTTRR